MLFNFTWLQVRTVVGTEKKKQRGHDRFFVKLTTFGNIRNKKCVYGKISRRRQKKQHSNVIGHRMDNDNKSEMLSVGTEKYRISR